MKRGRGFLYVVLAAGLIGLGASSGTFATFNAQTTNAGNTFSTGTINLTDLVSGSSPCYSYQGAGGVNGNANSGCGGIVNVDTGTAAPGTAVFNTVTITNGGSLDAPKFYLEAPWVNTELTTVLTSETSYTSLTVSPIEGNIVSGDTLVLSNGTSTQTVTATATAAGATSITVTSFGADANYYPGTIVTDTSSDTSATTNTDCYDSTANGLTPTASTTGDPLCNNLLMFVEETSQSSTGWGGSYTYCWVGGVSGTCPAVGNIGSALSTSAVITELPVSAGFVGGTTISSNGTIVVSDGAHYQTFTATGSEVDGDIPVSSATPNFAYPTTSAVIDSTQINTSSTVADFDTTYSPTRPLELTPLSGDGAQDTSGSLADLTHGGSRTFLVGLYLPYAATNSLQGLTSTFGISWYAGQ